ncbi:MAG: PAS domain S-box protein [Chloroflexota bacterium]|nr:PAS domain S-box protein [Chloroflexota bacterium]
MKLDYKKLYDQIPTAVFVSDPETGAILDCNDAAQKLVERTRDQTIGKPQHLLYPRTEAKNSQARFRDIVSNATNHTYETMVSTEQGKAVPVKVSSSMATVMGKEVVVQTFTNIPSSTEKGHHQQKPKKQEESLHKLLDAVHDIFIEIDTDGIIHHINTACEKALGWKRNEIVGTSISDYLHPTDVPYKTRVPSRKKRRDTISSSQMRIRASDGSYLAITSTSIPQPSTDRTYLIGTDPSQNGPIIQRIEDDDFKTLFELIPDPALIVGPDGRVLDVNGATCRETGYSREEVLDTSSSSPSSESDFIPEEEQPKALEMFGKMMAGEKVSVTSMNMRKKNGELIRTEINATPLIHNGRITRGIILARRVPSKYSAQDLTPNQEERYFRSLVENSSDVILVLEADGSIRYLSPTSERVTGFSEEEWADTGITEKIHPEDLPIIQEQLKALINSPNSTLHSEVRYHHKDGSWRIAEGIGNNMLHNPEINAIIINIRDVTERKQSEILLTESEHRYSSIVESCKEAIILIKDFNIMFLNKATTELTGYTQEDIYLTPFINLIPPEYLEQAIQRHQRNITGEDISNLCETQMIKKDGSIIPVELTSTVIEYQGGPAEVMFVRDISERNRNEQQLTESLITLQSIILNMQDGYLRTDVSANIIMANPRVAEIVGEVSLETLLGSNLERFVSSQQLSNLTQSLIAEGRVRSFELIVQRPDGINIPIELNAQAILDDNQAFVGFEGTARDITERKQLQTETETCRRRIEDILDSMVDAVILSDFEGRVTYANKAAANLAGYTREEIVEEVSTNSILIEEDYPKFLEQLPNVLSGISLSNEEYHIKTKDNAIMPVSINVSLLRDAEYKPEAIICTVRNSAECNRDETILSSHKELFQVLTENIPDAIAIMSKDGVIHYESPSIQRMFGYAPDELIGQNNIVLIHPDDVPTALNSFSSVVDSGNNQSVDVRFLRKDGSWLWTEIASHNLLNNPLIQGIVVNYRDITTRKDVEIKLRESEETLRSILDNMQDGYIRIDSYGNVVIANPRAAEMSGASSPMEYLGMNISDHMNPQRASELMNVLTSSGQVCGFESDIQRQDGSTVSIEINAHTIYDNAGNQIGYEGTIRDISMRKQAGNDLPDVDDRYNYLFNSPLQLVFVNDLEGNFLEANSQFQNITGHSLADLQHMSYMDIVHPDDISFTYDALAQVRMGESIPISELRLISKSGSFVWVNGTIMPLKRDNHVYAIIGFAQATEDRKLAEEQITRTTNHLNTILDSAINICIVSTDQQGYVTSWNHGAELASGYTKDEAIGKIHISQLIYSPDPKNSPIQNLVDEINNGITTSREMIGLSKCGALFPVAVNAAPLRSTDNTVIGAVAIVQDITERRRAEEELAALMQELRSSIDKLKQSNKELEDIIHIASHDLQEPLRKISSFGGILSQSLEGTLDADQQENLDFMVTGASQIRERIEALRDYSNTIRGVKHFRNINLNEAIRDIIEYNLASELGESNGTIEIPEGLPFVYADRKQLHQLLRHIIENGLRYRSESTPPRIVFRANQTEDERIRVEVEDNGVGIEQNYHQEVFTVFRRLHNNDNYKGTGIGLAICKSIIEQHGGEIGLDSSPGEGATFWFTLPMANQYETDHNDKPEI